VRSKNKEILSKYTNFTSSLYEVKEIVEEYTKPFPTTKPPLNINIDFASNNYHHTSNNIYNLKNSISK